MPFAWRTIRKFRTLSYQLGQPWTVRMPWRLSLRISRRQLFTTESLPSVPNPAWRTWSHHQFRKLSPIASPIARPRVWRPTSGSSTSAWPSHSEAGMTQLSWKETPILSSKNRKMVDKNRVAYSLSSVMLFNAKIGKHNYSFSLKHKFNLQTAFRSPAQSSVFILHSNCSRAHSWPWS